MFTLAITPSLTIAQEQTEPVDKQIDEQPQVSDTENDPAPEARWTLWAGYGRGFPQNEVSQPSHIDLGYSVPYGTRLETGFWFTRSQANVTDDVVFQTTGNRENREYILTSMAGGLRLQLRLLQRVFIFGNVGLSRTTSELTRVTTTAPVPSTLSPTRLEGEVWAMAYRVGLNYEYTYSRFGLGGFLAYNSTSSKQEAEIKDLVLGAYLKLYWYPSKIENGVTKVN